MVECNNETAGALVEQYNGKLQALTDKYAPPQNKTITLRPHVPWCTEALRREKRGRKKCERTATRTLLTVDREIAEERYARRTVQIEQAKAAYYTSQIDKNKGASKTLFKLTNSLMGKNGKTMLPTHSCDKTLADQFFPFFTLKLTTSGRVFVLWLIIIIIMRFIHHFLRDVLNQECLYRSST